MSEENQNQGQEQVDPILDKAKSAGWRPLEEFEGDPEQWVDAKEFVKRAPIYEKNRKLKREISELKSVVHEVKQHIGKVSQSAYNKAVADLNAQRDDAIEIGDKDQVKEIDKAIKEAEAIKVADDNVHPVLKEWVDNPENSWFNTDKDLYAFAVSFQDLLLKQNPDMSLGDTLKKTTEAVKRAYPDKFENPKRKQPPAVEPGGQSTGKKTFTESDLNDEQRKVMNKFVRQGVMSKEEYVKELADSGILGGKK